MIKLTEILGQPHIKAHLSGALLKDRVSHAYLLSGEEMAGKKTLALAFAQSLFCTHKDGGVDACGTCSSCIRIERGVHPDVRTVSHEKENSLRVTEVTQQVVDDAYLTPYEAAKKIYIIPDAELMTIEAQNKLLKTLEEPPAYAVFLLLATKSEALLPTVRSRLVPLVFRPVPDRILTDALTEAGHTPYRARNAVRFARGNTGRALMLADDEAFMERTRIAAEMMEQLQESPLSDISERLKASLGDTYDDRTTREELFLLIKMFVRDITIYKATESASHLIFADRIEYIRDVAQIASYRDLTGAFDATADAVKKIDANVNPRFTMESMMLRERDRLRRA